MMGRIRLAVFLLCALTATCSAAFADTPAAPGEALVVLENPLTEPLTEEALASVEGRLYVAEVAESVGARVEKVYPSLSEAGGTVFALFSAKGQTTEQLVEALKKRPEVLAASPNKRVRLVGGVPASADESNKASPEREGAEGEKTKTKKIRLPHSK